MPARLIVSDVGYVLQSLQGGSWADVAELPGGAAAIVPSGRAVDERALEAAIERAEDWLMLHAPHLRGEVLEVLDRTQRLTLGMDEVLSVTSRTWSVDEVEALFLRLVDMATGRLPSPALAGRGAFVADLLMLRELAHHGRLAEIRVV